MANPQKKILVTGGTGYIGSHTVVALIEQGFDVVIADNLYNSRREVLNAIHEITGKHPEFYEIDLCCKDDIRRIFNEHSISAIIHFAALKAVGESVEKPIRYYHNNLVSLTNLIELSIELGIKKFVFSSSCSVYGQPDIIPVPESAPLKYAESPYGFTKQISERILSDVSRVSDFKVIALRYFNPVGAHKSALIGDHPRNSPPNFMPVITQTAIGDREKLHVFGNDYNTIDGSPVRDYIHVVDLADAHIIATERLMKGAEKSNYEVFNIGTGTGLTVLEVLNAFEKHTGVKLKYEIGERRPGDVEKVYADIDFANRELGWKSKLGIKEMVESAWAWEQHIKKSE